MSATIPARLGKYEIRGTLGKGAMGTVYDGWDPLIDRRVAIKTAHVPDANDSDAQEALARFKREAQAAGRLSHPNIVGVFDYGETENIAFIVMEFVSGRSLKEILDTGDRLPLDATVRLMDDVLAGLAYSHERGVVHRDIKPANVMITQDQRAKIADFGIARIESSNMTQAGTVLGTPAYMSPEQFMGQTVDRRTDIYSTGVLLYQLLTGERPFEGGLTAIMHKVLNTTPPHPSELSVTAPTGLDAVVSRAMARRPGDRFDNATEFARAIHTGLSAPMIAAEPEADATIVTPRRPAPVREASPMTAPAPVTSKSSRLPLLLGGGAGLLIAAGVAAFVVFPGKSELASPKIATVGDKPTIPEPSAKGDRTSPPIGTTDTGDGKPAAKSVPVESEPVTPTTATTEGGDEKSDVPRGRPPQPPIVGTNSNLDETLRTMSPEAKKQLFETRGPRPTPADRVASAEVPGLVVPPTSGNPPAQTASVTKPPNPELRLNAAIQRAADALRPVPGASRLAFALLDRQQPVLSDNELMLMGLTTPNFAGHLRIDYIEHDGTVSHMVPSAAYPDRTYPAGTRVELGRPRGTFDGWKVGPPFGVDMVVAIVSTAPVFSASRPDGEPLETYLRDLQAATDNLRRLGGSLAADTVLLELRP